jgi:hypothetical protein
MDNKTNKIRKNQEIKVAILKAEPLFWKTCALRFFRIILDKYQWVKNSKKYIISTHFINDIDILKGELLSSHYDVLLIPGGGVGDGHSISKGFKLSIKTKKWKKQIQNFIKNGGGCIGFCGGASLITQLSMGEKRKPTTFVERQYNKSSLNISCVLSYYKYLAFPLFYPFQYNHPERIGTTAYVFSYEPGETKDGKRIHCGGVPLEFKINKNNPIFSDYPSNNLRIRWWGGQALIAQKKQDRHLKILATYPKTELHKNEFTKIHAWRYVGGISGLIKAFFKALKFIKKNKLKLIEFPMLTYYFAGDWIITNKLIKSDLANRPAITTEIYPNEKEGRITLCTAHPEYMIWYGGAIREQNNSNFHCLANGLYQWYDIEKINDTIIENITKTWWVVRRLVAWTGKVPDNELPPIEQQKLSKKDMIYLSKNIYWDGTLLNQMNNI